jgi:hypothetical protein
VVVIDELDGLLKRGHRVHAALLRLFQEPSRPGSRVVLLGISNAVDMTERSLPMLRELRAAPRLVVFTPYSAEQVEAIILHRLEGAVAGAATAGCGTGAGVAAGAAPAATATVGAAAAAPAATATVGAAAAASAGALPTGGSPHRAALTPAPGGSPADANRKPAAAAATAPPSSPPTTQSVMEATAVKYLAKRSAKTGDLRRALEVARRAVIAASARWCDPPTVRSGDGGGGGGGGGKPQYAWQADALGDWDDDDDAGGARASGMGGAGAGQGACACCRGGQLAWQRPPPPPAAPEPPPVVAAAVAGVVAAPVPVPAPAPASPPRRPFAVTFAEMQRLLAASERPVSTVLRELPQFELILVCAARALAEKEDRARRAAAEAADARINAHVIGSYEGASAVTDASRRKRARDAAAPASGTGAVSLGALQQAYTGLCQRKLMAAVAAGNFGDLLDRLVVRAGRRWCVVCCVVCVGSRGVCAVSRASPSLYPPPLSFYSPHPPSSLRRPKAFWHARTRTAQRWRCAAGLRAACLCAWTCSSRTSTSHWATCRCTAVWRRTSRKAVCDGGWGSGAATALSAVGPCSLSCSMFIATATLAPPTPTRFPLAQPLPPTPSPIPVSLCTQRCTQR